MAIKRETTARRQKESKVVEFILKRIEKTKKEGTTLILDNIYQEAQNKFNISSRATIHNYLNRANK